MLILYLVFLLSLDYLTCNNSTNHENNEILNQQCINTFLNNYTEILDTHTCLYDSKTMLNYSSLNDNITNSNYTAYLINLNDNTTIILECLIQDNLKLVNKFQYDLKVKDEEILKLNNRILEIECSNLKIKNQSNHCMNDLKDFRQTLENDFDLKEKKTIDEFIDKFDELDDSITSSSNKMKTIALLTLKIIVTILIASYVYFLL